MSDISIDVSNESPASCSPAAPNHTPLPPVVPLSPNTITSTLIANPDLDATMLQGITRSLIETTKNHEYINQIQVQCLEQQIVDLQARIDNPPTATNAEAPEGYEENWGQVPNFTIPTGEGFFQPAKYIKQLADRWVAGLGNDCGPDD
jgi:hypothetical protein